jgi:signal peptidase I
MSEQAPYAGNVSIPEIPAKKRWQRRLLIVFGSFLLFNLFGGALMYFVFGLQPVKVEGIAMSPTLNHGDKIFITRKVEDIKRGDIVIFFFPRDTSKSFIKRVVGLPGEMIRIDERGQVYINGSRIEEPYVDPDRNQHTRSMPEQVIKADHYFVIGDNRDASNDSRNWGQLPRSLIYGKYLWRYWAN